MAVLSVDRGEYLLIDGLVGAFYVGCRRVRNGRGLALRSLSPLGHFLSTSFQVNEPALCPDEFGRQDRQTGGNDDRRRTGKQDHGDADYQHRHAENKDHQFSNGAQDSRCGCSRD